MQTPIRKSGKYTNLKSDPYLTPDKFNELKSILTKLKKITRPAAMAEVKRLGEMGDFSENAAYSIAKGRLRYTNEKITALQNHLENAVIIKSIKNKDTVQLGHNVTIENNGDQKTYLILGSMETNPLENIISLHSPLGLALIGHKVGDKIKISLKNKTVEYKIINIK
ncbi:MAG: GreA/GreB family elongation factor [Patescibacteria group bacterium]